MNLLKEQEVFALMKTLEGNKAVFGACRKISAEAKALVKRIEEKAKKKAEVVQKSIDEEMDDGELRLEVRKHLAKKLRDGSLSAAEIAQLKDLFGLANSTSELSIIVVSYTEVQEEANDGE